MSEKLKIAMFGQKRLSREGTELDRNVGCKGCILGCGLCCNSCSHECLLNKPY